jgi:radical SAM/Cys-rich protein
VFEKSMTAMKMLNEVGYGKPDSGLILNLVYNPTGAFLPGGQAELQREFAAQLLKNFGVVFNNLFAISNMPISRFLDYLVESGNFETYMEKLVNSFNPEAAKNVMCRDTLSIGWDGKLYDCDFNQMLDLTLEAGAPRHISEFNDAQLQQRNIIVNAHCFGCTAGAGSSCGGELV